MKGNPALEREDTLIRRTRAGDLEAFEELIDQYGERIYTLSFQFLGNHTDAEDMVQEAFIQAYRNLETFQGNSMFSTWLFRIALNLCSNYRKKNKRLVLMSPSALATLNHRSEECGINTPHNLLETREAVRVAMDSLSPPLRRALFLVAVRALSHREAARIEGCAPGTMSWRIFKARQYLRESLTDYLD
jgi:RNA polymerase sigma-70 factor (ECF subfamily)